MATAIQVVFDCADPERLAAFWAATLGYTLQAPPDGMASWEAWLTAQGIPEDQWNNASAIVDPDGAGPRIFFQRVPEPKTVKNRVHLDVNVGGGHTVDADEGRRRVTAEVERLRGLGARQIAVFEERGEYWIVMADPEGNEFCLQ
jgi:hypothetical protein